MPEYSLTTMVMKGLKPPVRDIVIHTQVSINHRWPKDQICYCEKRWFTNDQIFLVPRLKSVVNAMAAVRDVTNQLQ